MNNKNIKTNSLFTAEEKAQLRHRKIRGELLRYFSLIPVVLGFLLIVFVFYANINSSFVWQLVDRGGSGQVFNSSEIKNDEQAYRLELNARGMSKEDIDDILTDPKKRRKFLLRNRVDQLLEANGKNKQTVVYTIERGMADKIEEQVPYFAGLANKTALQLRAKEEGLDLFLNPLLDRAFIIRNNSSRPLMAGFRTAIIGTLWVIGLLIFIASFVAVATAIYLEEYAQKGIFSSLLEINLRNLAGVPSIVYGILGLYVFVRAAGFGDSVIAASLTLSLLILPVVVIAAREAIRAVPDSLRQASYGLGATKWQTVSRVILPNSIAGIVTGIVLAVARALGETAPLLLVGGAGFITTIPGGWDVLKDSFSVMPLQIYSYFATPDQAFKEVAAAGIMVLLIILIFIYLFAFIIRAQFSRKW